LYAAGPSPLPPKLAPSLSACLAFFLPRSPATLSPALANVLRPAPSSFRGLSRSTRAASIVAAGSVAVPTPSGTTSLCTARRCARLFLPCACATISIRTTPPCSTEIENGSIGSGSLGRLYAFVPGNTPPRRTLFALKPVLECVLRCRRRR
ncbi:unnamed protein product, partial [Ectocarpus sp. 4 AP-2014]